MRMRPKKQNLTALKRVRKSLGVVPPLVTANKCMLGLFAENVGENVKEKRKQKKL